MPASSQSPLEELLPALHLLDGLLERSVPLAEGLQSGGAKGTEENLPKTDRLQPIEFALPPGYPRYSPAQSGALPSSQVQPDSRLGRLQRQFKLSNFDLDVIFLALALELDRRYEQIYAYLQQDGRSFRPSVNLVLNLLCTDAAEKLKWRSRFSPTAPLLHHHLLQLSPPQPTHHSSLLAQEISLDPAIVRYLLDETGLDADLSLSCSLVQVSDPPAQIGWPAPLAQPLEAMLQGRRAAVRQSSEQPIRLYLQSADFLATRQFAHSLAHHLDRPLLTVDLETLLRQPEQFQQRLRRLGRDAWLQNTVLYLHPLDSVQQDSNAHCYPLLIHLLAETDVPIVLAGRQPWQPSADRSLGMVTIALETPGFSDRLACWNTYLKETKLTVQENTIKALADRFRLTPLQIRDAIATTHNQLAYGMKPASMEASLFQAVRSQSGHQLTRLAQPIHPRYGWADLILPEVQFEQLQEICIHLQYRYKVFETWGFDRKLSLGKGVNALFAGPSGTGKTMAAEVIARALELDLYRIDLSQVVSKYIGETEKNLSQIFTAAAHANAILLFDEADSLFGKRTEIKDSHDRYANIEVGYLLQQMEAYEGLAILTTNLKSNLDEAFIRRLRFIVEFPFPSVRERSRIWQNIWPETLPIDPQIDWQILAKQFELTGGNIRNIALAAAFLAANEAESVNLSHISQAIRREYQKMGKPMMN
jgi:hypothetical protein